MENTKKVNIIVISLLCLLVLALIGYIIFQDQKIDKLSKGPNPQTTVHAESTDNLKQDVVNQDLPLTKNERDQYEDEISHLRTQVEDAEDELDAIFDKQNADSTGASPEKTGIGQFSSAMNNMLKDPEMKKMLRAQARTSLDLTYGALFEELNLSPEDLDKFKDLLVDYQMKVTEISFEMIGDATDDERREMGEEAKLIRDDYDQKISEFLGNENYNQYKSYQETLTERTLVSGFSETLDTGEQLNDQQEAELMDLMYQERKEFYSSIDYDPEEENEFTLPSEEIMAKEMERLDQTYEKYREAGEGILSASQMEKFDTFLTQRREMTEMAMKLSSQLLGGQAENNSQGNTTE